jgi:hypothetical protein
MVDNDFGEPVFRRCLPAESGVMLFRVVANFDAQADASTALPCKRCVTMAQWLICWPESR